MSSKVIYGIEDILAILPHRPPFLFVDRITQFKPNSMIVTERMIRKDEPYFAGHFPGNPIMPGVLITDALAQTSGLLWGFSKQVEEKGKKPESESPEMFFLAATNIKFPNPAYPCDTLKMTSFIIKNYGSLYSYNVEAVVKRKVVAKGSLTLAVNDYRQRR